MPKLETSFPCELQSYLLANARKAYRDPLKRVGAMLKVLSLAQKIQNLDEKIESALQDCIVDFLTKDCTKVLDCLNEDQLDSVHQFVNKEGSRVLCTAMMKRCKFHKAKNKERKSQHQTEVQCLLSQHQTEIQSLQKELGNFKRFNGKGLKNKLFLACDRNSGELNPERTPTRLPPHGDRTEQGWVYKDYAGVHALYTYDA